MIIALRAFKMVGKFKTVVTRVLTVLELAERLRRIKRQLRVHKKLNKQKSQPCVCVAIKSSGSYFQCRKIVSAQSAARAV